MRTFLLPAIAALLVFIETTWLADLTLFGAQPEIALLVVLFYGHRNGVQRGQIAGFVVGIVHDALTVAPIGFYAVLGLISGAIAGATRDAFRTDSALAPPALTLVVMIARSLGAIAMSLVLGLPTIRSLVFSMSNLFEITLTVVMAPIVFALLKLVQERRDDQGARF